MSINRKAIASNITTFMRLKGYSRLSFSKLTGISRPEIDQILNAEPTDPVIYNSQISRITDTFSLSADYFLTNQPMIDFDDGDDIGDGIYAVPSPKCLPQYSLRQMLKYKQENGIEGPLSDEEIKQFRIEPKGFICRQVDMVEEATHWLPTLDNEVTDKVTPYHLYRIFLDRYDSEYLIVDNEGKFSLIHLWRNGRYVILENTWR